MMDDPFTPEEQKLIQRLRTTSRPKLKASTREAIRQQVVAEFRTTVRAAHRSSKPHAHQPRSLMRFAAAAVAMTVVVSWVILQARHQRAGNNGSITATASPGSQVAVVPSETPESTAESLTPTFSATPTPSMTAEAMPVLTVTTALPTQTATLITPTPTPASETLVVVEGPITNVVDNVITIYDISIEVEPQHPLLNLIDVGDYVRVEGTYGSSGMIVASAVSNIPSTTVAASSVEATVNLDGPVEAIDGNLVTINGIHVQLDPANPILRTLQVGNFVSVQGNFQGSGATIVLIVVNFTVINNVTTIESNCWYHDKGMGMGHWHCDGMGMGMGMGTSGMGK